MPDLVFDALRRGEFPFDGLSDYDVRVALFAAHGVLDDHGLVDRFAYQAEEDIVEARAQASAP
jgi:hypothetical protein